MKPLYDQVPQSEDDTELQLISLSRSRKQWKRTGIWSLLSNLVLLTSLALQYVVIKNQDYVQQTSSYSPIFKDIHIPLHTEVFNGTLFPNSDPPSVWRQSPSPEVDEAWNNLAETALFAITHDDVIRLGRDPDVVTKVPTEWMVENPTSGPLYLAQLDGQHTLHCLNSLRKYAYFDHYHGDRYKSTAQMPIFDQVHLSHCVDILRQNLMCQMSTDIITFEWREAYDRPHPMFSIEKVCRNNERILDWVNAKNLTLTIDQVTVIPRPAEGVVESPASPYWLDLIKQSKAAGVPAREYMEDRLYE